ncbi:MAG: hypothetical protein CL770_03970 [Chloroflexi bacterium]|nr:hypothetical protein [Chloroflexota bacterium]
MKSFLILNTLIILIVFSFSCGDQGESGPKFGTGTLKQAVYNLNKAPSNPNSDTGTTGRVDRFVDLPLLLWPSFEYRRIPRVVEKDKVEHCLITESEGAQLQPGTKVEVIDEARCFYVRLNYKDGIPRSYTTTFAQIRVIETGEEGWTWSKAIEFDKE